MTAFVLMLVHRYGLVALFGAIGLEAMGIPLPAETALLVLTAYAAHSGAVSAWLIFGVAAAAAVLGDNLGYAVGRFAGWPVLSRFRRVLRLSQERLKVARYLFQRHGGAVVGLGRFVAVLRTTAAFLAGVNHMPWARFLVVNALGGLAWAAVWTVVGSTVGAHVSAGPVTWTLVGAALVGVLGTALVVRRHWASLVARAEAELPAAV